MDQAKLVAFAQELILLPSLSGQEGPVAQRIVAEMHALGYDRVAVDENGSVVGVIDGALPGRTILLDGHMDTVGVAKGTPWRNDPFGGVIVDGALTGRGSADMKGSLAAMVHAAAAVDRSRLAGCVAVSATPLEEVLEGVTLRTVMDRVRPDCVVVGEATDLHLNRGGRGRAEVVVETRGRMAHSASPQLGRNAVLDMMRAVAAIETIQLPSDPVLGPAIMTLTDIMSLPYPGHSIIPGACRVTYDRRLLPGETPDDVLAPIRTLPGLSDPACRVSIEEGEYSAYTGQVLHSPKFFPAWVLAEDHWFVQRARHGLTQAGLPAELGAYRFCTNATYSAGIADVPTVGFGPATEADAHVVDEQVRLDHLFAAVRGFVGIIHAVLA